MVWILTHDTLTPETQGVAGGKTRRIAQLRDLGCTVPPWFCVTTEAYNAFLDQTGMRERIALELHRKVFEEMRWEEIWDCALRIRHMFQTVPLPSAISEALVQAVEDRFVKTPVAVRSSALDEDSHKASFAGLHASYVNVRGADEVIDHIRKVWASLWSDAALLYRKEIGLDVSRSAMAVIVQGLVSGQCSGVVFTRSPTQADQLVIEAVHGLNQGLVDGTIEPDRWQIDRVSRKIVSHTPAQRKYAMAAVDAGVEKIPLDENLAESVPLTTAMVSEVVDTALEIEAGFGSAQDIEWTFDQGRLVMLQSRDVTTQSGSGDDQRGWYLSLHRSFEQLTILREKIEGRFIPEMIETANRLDRIDLGSLDAEELIRELDRRWNLNQHWSAIYWSDFIPYAHGVRLFGQFYNDALAPDDPYEFMDLLTATDMQSLQRNQRLQELAQMLAREPEVAGNLSPALDCNAFEINLDQFLKLYGDLSTGVTGRRCKGEDLTPLMRLLTEMGRHPQPLEISRQAITPEARQAAFLNRFSGKSRERANAMLDLARSSHQLRDDDNIHLSRIEAHYLATVDEARQRLSYLPESEQKTDLATALENKLPELEKGTPAPEKSVQGRFTFRQRQLVGQPAGPGIAKGVARVITADDQLTQFKADEILVCDAVDPNMTFVVPLAAGIVERRGGMLIHGAIIAREYGLPCITGVPGATQLIRNGDTITVDGYLGIVTLG